MTAEQKAEELVNKFLISTPLGFHIDDAKQCALIAVDEVMKQCWEYRDIDLQKSFDYWQEVKQKIQQL